jgi:hypothetical protein
LAFSVHADGTIVSSDSTIFAQNASVAHGQWVSVPPTGIRATSTLLQSAPTGVFIGGLKLVMDATVAEHDKLEGTMTSFLYAYTDPAGRAIIGPDGLPTPSPLTPTDQCSAQPGCTRLGTFTFLAKRVKP